MKKRVLSLLLVLLMLVPASPVLASESCNHEWSSWYEDIEPDCGNSGRESRYCYNCDEEQYRSLPATGDHDWDDWYVSRNATIYKTGVKKRECWYCGKIQTATIPKLKPFIKLNKKKLSLTAGKSYRLKISYARGDSVKKCTSSNKKLLLFPKKVLLKLAGLEVSELRFTQNLVKKQLAKLL